MAHCGHLLENPSWWNAAVLVTVTIGQLVRIQHKEAVQSQDPEYAAYQQRTRWRLVPLVY